jgi:hypothetical protein
MQQYQVPKKEVFDNSQPVVLFSYCYYLQGIGEGWKGTTQKWVVVSMDDVNTLHISSSNN